MTACLINLKSAQKFISGMSLAVFDNNGNVINAIHSDDYELLAKNINGKFVVGISILESQPGQVSYFYGRISPDGRGIVQKPLNENVLLSANEVITNM